MTNFSNAKKRLAILALVFAAACGKTTVVIDDTGGDNTTPNMSMPSSPNNPNGGKGNRGDHCGNVNDLACKAPLECRNMYCSDPVVPNPPLTCNVAGENYCPNPDRCVSLNDDSLNCGACNNKCATGWSCSNAKCVQKPTCGNGALVCSGNTYCDDVTDTCRPSKGAWIQNKSGRTLTVKLGWTSLGVSAQEIDRNFANGEWFGSDTYTGVYASELPWTVGAPQQSLEECAAMFLCRNRDDETYAPTRTIFGACECPWDWKEGKSVRR